MIPVPGERASGGVRAPGKRVPVPVPAAAVVVWSVARRVGARGAGGGKEGLACRRPAKAVERPCAGGRRRKEWAACRRPHSVAVPGAVESPLG